MNAIQNYVFLHYFVSTLVFRVTAGEVYVDPFLHPSHPSHPSHFTFTYITIIGFTNNLLKRRAALFIKDF